MGIFGPQVKLSKSFSCKREDQSIPVALENQ